MGSLVNENSEALLDHGMKTNLMVDNASGGSEIEGPQLEEIAMKGLCNGDEGNYTVKLLTEKLSAALLNVSLKDDLVKQHALVAEEAVAGWERAEKEVDVVKQQLETVISENLALEAQVNHLDEALKECVRQLRFSRDEQQSKFNDVLAEKTHNWNTVKAELEEQLSVLQYQLEASRANSLSGMEVELCNKINYLEKVNAALRKELAAQTEELEVRTIERDLSTRVAEAASKQHLDSISKIAKLESECRKLKAQTHKSLSVNEHKSTVASSSCVESIPDSQSDYTEQLNYSDIENHRINSGARNECEPGCSDSWASALVAELDRFKTENIVTRKSLPSSSMEIDLMDDFLDMERIVAIQQNDNEVLLIKTRPPPDPNGDNQLIDELAVIIYTTIEMEQKIEKVEASLAEVQSWFEKSQLQLMEVQKKLEQQEVELHEANKLKQDLEVELNKARAEAQTMSRQIMSLNAQLDKDRSLSAELSDKCHLLKRDLWQKKWEIEFQRSALINREKKMKQDGLATAAGKLAECQKTISSLGNQLKTLATMEEFLTDTADIPGFSTYFLTHKGGVAAERGKLCLNDALSSNIEDSKLDEAQGGFALFKNQIDGGWPLSSSLSSSAELHSGSGFEKIRSGFEKPLSQSLELKRF